jgi:arginine repressor
MSSTRKTIIQQIVDIIYSSGCIKREEIVEELAKRGYDRKRLMRTVAKDLQNLVKRGVVVRKAYAIYCKP